MKNLLRQKSRARDWRQSAITGASGPIPEWLARKIENPNYKLREREKSIEGINVIGYQIDTAIRARDDGKEKVLQRRFQVNIWDFGGQEIYHATHQFFLTRRSVYVLVCDDRKEDTDFSYWLQAVEMLTSASPLLIVQNEKQDRTRDINASSLRARFSNLPHVGVGLPATWKRVRRVPRDLPAAWIHAPRRQIAVERVPARSRHLPPFLGRPAPETTVILKPSWGTDAVYRVLEDPEVIAARAQFRRRQLDRIWSEAPLPARRGEGPGGIVEDRQPCLSGALRDYGQVTSTHVPQQDSLQQLLVCGPDSQSSQFSMISLKPEVVPQDVQSVVHGHQTVNWAPTTWLKFSSQWYRVRRVAASAGVAMSTSRVERTRTDNTDFFIHCLLAGSAAAKPVPARADP